LPSTLIELKENGRQYNGTSIQTDGIERKKRDRKRERERDWS